MKYQKLTAIITLLSLGYTQTVYAYHRATHQHITELAYAIIKHAELCQIPTSSEPSLQGCRDDCELISLSIPPKFRHHTEFFRGNMMSKFDLNQLKPIKQLLLVASLVAGLIGCGAGIGDECGPDAGGVHGETLCSEGTCVHDPRALKSICLEDNLPQGTVCVSDTQCGTNQQKLYCQHASDNAQTGQCAPALNENEPCNLLAHCNEGLFCIKDLCRPQQPIGGPCWISPVIQHCQDGLICGLPDGLTLPLDEEELKRYDIRDGRCRVGGKEGEACNDNSGIGCAPGFYCKDNNTICVKGKREGK